MNEKHWIGKEKEGGESAGSGGRGLAAIRRANYCRDCRFWERDLVHLQMGVCSNPNFVDLSEKANVDIEADQIGFYDHENFGVSFVTGERFGCVHFSDIHADSSFSLFPLPLRDK